MASDGLPKNMEPLDAADPASIGPYTLVGRLGSGGMGTVYLGRAPERESLIAIKVIRPELAFDEATRARFRDEMENARRVASFCTAKVLDHGTFENRPYMVTEYISGTALAEHIAEHGALDSSTLHGFALGVAAALAAIHGAGLVHRDLKPANVLLSLSGPRVIDFGIARALNTRSNHTQTGIVMGSPGWMAPEQLLEETVTTKADIFAWGCLVAYAGTGNHPFGNGDAMTLGKRVLFAEPQLGALDSPLDRLVRQALSKEPQARPNAQDLLLELAGGGKDANDPNAMVSHALHESWRPNLPPPGAPPQPGYGMPPRPGFHGPGAPQPPPQGAAPPGTPPPRQGPPQGAPQGAPPAPAHQSQRMQRPAHPPGGPGAPQSPNAARNTGQFPVASPNQTGPIPQVPQGANPNQTQGGARPHPGQPYVPPVPPASQKPADPDRNRMRWLAVVAAAGIVLLLLIFVLLTWLGSSGRLALPWSGDGAQEAPGDDEDPAAELNDPDQASQDAELPEGALSVAEDEWVEFTVFEPECGVDSHGVVTSTNGSYCRFPIQAENVSGSPVSLNWEWQELSTEDTNVVSGERPAPADRDDVLWSPIAPGQQAEGTLVFLVEDGVAPQELILRGNETSDGVRIRLPPDLATE